MHCLLHITVCSALTLGWPHSITVTALTWEMTSIRTLDGSFTARGNTSAVRGNGSTEAIPQTRDLTDTCVIERDFGRKINHSIEHDLSVLSVLASVVLRQKANKGTKNMGGILADKMVSVKYLVVDTSQSAQR